MGRRYGVIVTSDKRANREAADWRRGGKISAGLGEKTAWCQLGPQILYSEDVFCV